MTTTVGETRAWLNAWFGVANTPTTHYVIVADSPAGARIITCCDGTDEAGSLLAAALRAIGGNPALAPESGSVIVGREDLQHALKHMAVDGEYAQAVRDRLAEAAGVS